MKIPKSQFTSESYLLSLGKWAILSVKIPGYFPFKITPSLPESGSGWIIQGPGPRLSFSFMGTTSIYTLLLLLAIALWDLVFFVRLSSFNKYLKARGPTEIYAYTLMIAISSFLGVYITIFCIRSGHKFIQFWKETSELLDDLRKLSQDLLGMEDFHDHFEEIQRSTRNAFLSLIIPVVIHVVVGYGYRIASTIMYEDGSAEDTELAIGLGFWTFFELKGSGIAIWMAFFVQIYTACLQTIQMHLHSLRRFNMDPNGDMAIIERHEHDTHSRSVRGDGAPAADHDQSDMDELFSRVILHHQNQRAEETRKPLRPSLKGPQAIEADVQRSLKTFQHVLKCIDSFNDFFGVILIFEISVCVLNLLVYLFFALVWLGRGELGLLMEGAVPTYVYGKELYDMGSVSEELTSAAANVVRTFSEDLPLHFLTPTLHLKLQMLATQISTNPPSVSAKQFFVINRSLITAVLSGLATFLVVLVQFREADSDSPTNGN